MKPEEAIAKGLHVGYGTTTYGGMGFRRPREIREDGLVVVRDSDCEPARSVAKWNDAVERGRLWEKVGMWAFEPAGDSAVDAIRYCHQNPEAAGRELHRLRSRKCATCQYWKDRHCERLPRTGSPVTAYSECSHDGQFEGPAGEFMTTEDFGCELWEERNE